MKKLQIDRFIQLVWSVYDTSEGFKVFLILKRLKIEDDDTNNANLN